jgi:hypothetical protein
VLGALHEGLIHGEAAHGGHVLTLLLLCVGRWCHL